MCSYAHQQEERGDEGEREGGRGVSGEVRERGEVCSYADQET